MSLDDKPTGEVAVTFLCRATDYTRMRVSDETIAEFLIGLQTFPKNDALWIKAHTYFESKGTEAGYNVIARAFLQNPGNKEIVERFAETSIKMGIHAREAGNAQEADGYFEDAERIYFDLSYAFDWHTVTKPLENLYRAWGRAENAECCANALQEPFDINAIRFLVEQRDMLDVKHAVNNAHHRVSNLPDIKTLVPEQR